jgi:membrane fusion protein (multidrug efflux system)
MNIDKLFVEVEVSEKELPSIKDVKDITVEAQAYPGEQFKGKIYDTEVLVSTISRTVKVKVVIENSKHRIKPGMYARVKMLLPEVGSVVVPRMAVSRQTGSNVHYLFTEDKGIVKRKNIEIVKDLGDFLAIEGVSQGENVVSAGKSKLKSGMTVAVIAENGVQK